MKKLLCLLLSITIFFAGCAGREANPVAINQLGDEQKSCEMLRAEMGQVENEIARLMPKSDKTGRNIACAATGILFIVPLFFMDLKEGEKIEVEAYRQRYNRLVLIAKEKGCSLSGVKADLIPSFEEQAKNVIKEQEKAKSSTAPSPLITCANCNRQIGKLETAYLYREHVVCSECYKKLKNQ